MDSNNLKAEISGASNEGGNEDSSTAVEQSSALLKLPGESRNRIYDHALASDSAILLRVRGLACDCGQLAFLLNAKHEDGSCTKCQATPSLRFGPAEPAITRTCRKLREETRNYYPPLNTFLLSDTMLQPEVLSALKEARPGVATMRKVKIYHTLPLRGRYGIERFTLRFTAEADEQSEIRIMNINSKGTHDFKKGLCACFVEHMAKNASIDVPAKAEVLFKFVEQYVDAMARMDEVSDNLCEKCGRHEALESFVWVFQPVDISSGAISPGVVSSGAMSGREASLYETCFGLGIMLAVGFALWHVVRWLFTGGN